MALKDILADVADQDLKNAVEAALMIKANAVLYDAGPPMPSMPEKVEASRLIHNIKAETFHATYSLVAREEIQPRKVEEVEGEEVETQAMSTDAEIQAAVDSWLAHHISLAS